MSGCIDRIYKDLTKGTGYPTGGVGFLSLEDAEVRHLTRDVALLTGETGAIPEWCQIQCHAARQAVRRDGAAFWRRKDDGGAGAAILDS